MRIYITLNESNEKDKKILDFLDNTYSAKDYIKQMLWDRANGQNATLEMQKVTQDKKEEVKESVLEVQSATVEVETVDDDVMKFFN